ncbi:hypothetical protein RUM43_007459 [Polyplax serrata]|uniref:Uncharacterized protein n=1 Tax=Polyplax serrata TaxID=468196 RepID=A0AAN8P1Y0_POLSC
MGNFPEPPGEKREGLMGSIHEVPGVRLPLQTNYASPPHAVFMYSTTSEGVTLQLRDTDDIDDKAGLASVLARLQQEDATLSISYQETEMLAESSIDVLLGASSLHSNGGILPETKEAIGREAGKQETKASQRAGEIHNSTSNSNHPTLDPINSKLLTFAFGTGNG